MPCAQVAEGDSARRSAANPLRGEAAFAIAGRRCLLRPSFAALVAAEDELGSLFALVERAGDGRLLLSEMAALFWHCLARHDGLSREAVDEAVLSMGLAEAAKPLRVLLGEILKGRG
jgi:hypothetical protein